MQAEKKSGAGEVTGFGCAAVVTGSLVDEQRTLRGQTALTAHYERAWASTGCAALHLYCARWKPPGLRRGLATNWAQM